tara:strand:+ start:90 stop:365 length:276 start_codon:yes stop_codon:yes gene_type:complete
MAESFQASYRQGYPKLMQLGDLVKNKRTKAIGMILRVPKGRHCPRPGRESLTNGFHYSDYDVYFDVEWYDGCDNPPGSHLTGELVPINEGR